MTSDDGEVHQRIDTLLDSAAEDRIRTQQLFQYAWTIICVRRGLLKEIKRVPSSRGLQIVLEEVNTGQRRLVSRPDDLDDDLESLAAQALDALIRDRFHTAQR